MCLILLGTNDTPEACWDRQRFVLDLEALVRSFQRLPSQPAVVLLIPPSPRDDPAALLEFGVRGHVIRHELWHSITRLAKRLQDGRSAGGCGPGTVHALDMQLVFRRSGCSDPASDRCAALYANDNFHTSVMGADLIANATGQLLSRCT